MGNIITRHDREYILESILYPNKQIAPGFESVLVRTKDGQAYAGILKNENANDLTLNSSEDGVYSLIKVTKANIQSRERGLSAMPEGLNRSSPRKTSAIWLNFWLRSNKSRPAIPIINCGFVLPGEYCLAAPAANQKPAIQINYGNHQTTGHFSR